MLLRANLINKGNPFFRYARSRVMGRADYSEKELASFVEPHVTKEGKWNGPLPENYLGYTDFMADIGGSTHPGWKPSFMWMGLAGMFGGLFLLNNYYQNSPEKGADRPYTRKQFPYNSLYLERGGDPTKLHLLPAIEKEVYDPYPYYGENSIDYKQKHGIPTSSHH